MNIQPTASACSFSHLSGKNLHGMRFRSGAEDLFVKKPSKFNSYFQDVISEIRKSAAVQTKQFIDFFEGKSIYPILDDVEMDSAKMNGRFELIA